jgi:hypothetical protein
MGFPLQSFAPLVQPCAVSDADTLMTLESTPDKHHRPQASSEKPRLHNENKRPKRDTANGDLASRVLLHTKVRHRKSTV